MTNQHLIIPPPEMVEKWVRMLEARSLAGAQAVLAAAVSTHSRRTRLSR